MNKKKLYLIFLTTILASPFIALAQNPPPGGGTRLTAMASAVQTAATSIGLSIAVVGWVVAGILYLTAAGGPRMETAKKAMIAAVIGTLLVVLAQAQATIRDLINTTFGLQ